MMKKFQKLSVVSALIAFHSQAALPPQYQNDKDLNVMVGFVKSYEEVISTLENINMKNFTVVYKGYDYKKENSCIASFTRKARTFDGPGPAGDLIFKSSTCKLKKK